MRAVYGLYRGSEFYCAARDPRNFSILNALGVARARARREAKTRVAGTMKSRGAAAHQAEWAVKVPNDAVRISDN
jgi:hypothetical protein